jgi:hypothetical protein
LEFISVLIIKKKQKVSFKKLICKLIKIQLNNALKWDILRYRCMIISDVWINVLKILMAII